MTKITRSSDGWFAGVCEGAARSYGVDPMLLRIGFVVTLIFSGGLAVFAYLALWWLMPPAGNPPLEATVWQQGSGGMHPPLSRTAVDKKFFGVCGGIARRFDVDPTLVRLATLAAFLASGGLVLCGYILGIFLMPSDKRLFRRAATAHRTPAYATAERHPVDL